MAASLEKVVKQEYLTSTDVKTNESSESMTTDSHTTASSDCKIGKNQTPLKRRSFTMKEKLKILKCLDTESVHSISTRFNLHQSVLRKWVQKKAEMKEICEKKYLQNRKKNRTAANVDIDDALYAWFLEARTNGIPMTMSLLQRKALTLNAELGGNKNFWASNGWFYRWKLRKGIHRLTVADEKLSDDTEVADQDKIEFLNVIKEEKGKMAASLGKVVKQEYLTSTDAETNESNESMTTDLHTTASSDCSMGENQQPSKKRSFTMKEKLQILKCLDTESIHSICTRFNLHQSVLRKWVQKKAEMKEICKKKNLQNRKKNRTAANVDIDDALYAWFLAARTSGIPMTTSLLQRKALTLNAELGGNKNFRASNGWFYGWKLRKGIHRLTVADEKLSDDTEEAADQDKIEFFSVVIKEEKGKMAASLERVVKQEYLTSTDVETNESSESMTTDSHTIAFSDCRMGKNQPPLKRKSFTMKEKLQILKCLDTESVHSICTRFNLHQSVLRKWLQKKAEMKEICEKKNLQNRKKNRAAANVDIDDALYAWFLEARTSGIPMTMSLLQKKALTLNAELGGNKNFWASTGWFYRWKLRKGIHRLTVADEKFLDDTEAADQDKIEFSNVVIKEEKGKMAASLEKVVKQEYLTSTDVETNESSESMTTDSHTTASSDCSMGENQPPSKKRSFTMKEKLQILKCLDTESVHSICTRFNLHQSVLRKWVQKKAELKEICEKKNLQNRKKNRAAANVDIDDALYAWFLEARTSGIPMTTSLLQRKALTLNAELGGNKNFRASNGWFYGWKLRKGIHRLTVADEKLSDDTEEAADQDKIEFSSVVIKEEKHT